MPWTIPNLLLIARGVLPDGDVWLTIGW